MQTQPQQRQAWLATLAHSQPQQLAKLWQAQALSPSHEILRQPETGLAQVSGRMGATGDAFNIGDTTLTRAVVRLESGEIGVGYVTGRDKQHCLRIALIDALLQTSAQQPLLEQIIEPLANARQQALATKRSQTQASKVDFFTLVRGESE